MACHDLNPISYLNQSKHFPIRIDHYTSHDSVEAGACYRPEPLQSSGSSEELRFHSPSTVRVEPPEGWALSGCFPLPCQMATAILSLLLSSTEAWAAGTQATSLSLCRWPPHLPSSVSFILIFSYRFIKV